MSTLGLLKPSVVYNEHFKRDICDFFSQRRSGHIGTWRYSDPLFSGDRVKGMQYWADLVKSARGGNNYYIVNEEIEVIQLAAKNLSHIIPKQGTLIDLGPGSKEALLEKAGPFIRNLDTKLYIGVDVSAECLSWAKETIEQDFSGVNCKTILGDFYDDLIFPKMGTPVMCMFGQTIFNLPIHPLDLAAPSRMTVQRLRQFKRSLGRGGYLILAQDCNQNADNIYDAYMEAEKFNMNLLHRIERDLPVSPGFDVDNFYFEPQWIPETGAATLTYVCKQNMDFSIGNETFNLKAGQRFYMHNSYKFELSKFQKMAWSAGFRIHSSQFTKSRRMALHVLKVVE